MTNKQRAIIFANGLIRNLEPWMVNLDESDLLIAADGGASYCRQIGLTPSILIGDFDSLDKDDLNYFTGLGAEIIRHPAQKDYTDLELSLRHAQSLGVQEILVHGALGARWDQTLANILLPAIAELKMIDIRLIDENQEVRLLHGGRDYEVYGQSGDTLSLIPIGGDARGVRSIGLEYPLQGETLFFGATRGVSNRFMEEKATIHIDQGTLICIIIHQ